MNIKISDKKKQIRKSIPIWYLILFAYVCFLINCQNSAFGVSVIHKENKENNAVLIDVKKKAAVEGETIFLADISAINARPDLVERIGRLKIGISPKIGKEIQISGNKIVSIIQSLTWMPEEAMIVVPDIIYIERAFQTISEEKLESLFHNHISSKLIDSTNYKVSDIQVKGKVRYPLGNLELNIKESDSKRSSHKKNAGRMSINISVNINGDKAGKINVTGWVDRFEKVVLTTRSIPRGTILTKNDLCEEVKNISKSSAGTITTVDQAVGKRIKRNIRSGAMIKHSMMEVPPLINKGDMVKLVAKNDGLTVETTGLAKSSGPKGSQIFVRNLRSERTIVGYVIDASTVEVKF